ncbi:hypothetical protein Tco_1091094 [Tanacetum coccineum]|uniref:Uncharacterized protein n=1 Tax=Tanacetum coccineum TaxID=301880 RepID=A0ABQ5I763_9ASTR
MDDGILSSDDTTTDSFFKPYLKTQGKNNTGKDNEQRQTKRKCKDANLEANNTSNTLNNERPNKRMCNAERFEAIKYSLGPNEEYIAIRRCEYDTWERNDDTMSQIYQEILQKKDNRWKARILELKRRYFEDYYSEDQYAVSIKEDTSYLCLHSPKTTKETKPIRRIQERQYAVSRKVDRYGNANLGHYKSIEAEFEFIEPGFELIALKMGRMGSKWVVRLEYLLRGFKDWTLYFNSASWDSWDFLDQKLAAIDR